MNQSQTSSFQMPHYICSHNGRCILVYWNDRAELWGQGFRKRDTRKQAINAPQTWSALYMFSWLVLKHTHWKCIARKLWLTHRPPGHISTSQKEASNSAPVSPQHCLSRREDIYESSLRKSPWDVPESLARVLTDMTFFSSTPREKHYPQNCNTAPIFQGLQNHTFIETKAL